MDFQIPDLDKLPLRPTGSNPLPVIKPVNNNDASISNRQPAPLLRKIGDSQYDHPATIPEMSQYANVDLPSVEFEKNSVYDYPQNDDDPGEESFYELQAVGPAYGKVQKASKQSHSNGGPTKLGVGLLSSQPVSREKSPKLEDYAGMSLADSIEEENPLYAGIEY